MEVVGGFKSVVRNNQTNIVVDMEKSFSSNKLAAAAAPMMMKFHVCIKQSRQLQLVDHLGVPLKTLTMPLPNTTVVNHHKEFPIAQAWPYLTHLLSSVALIPPDLLNATVFQIFNYAAVLPSRATAVVHVKADLTVLSLNTEVLRAGSQQVNPASYQWIHTGHRVDHDDVIEPPAMIVIPEQYRFRLLENCCVCWKQLIFATGKSSSPSNLGREVLKLPCSHLLHCRCLFMWFKTSDESCPLCRALIP